MKEISPTTVALLSIAVLLAIMAYSAVTYKPAFDNSTFVIIEEPIEKNAQLQIRPGESYVYSYFFNDTQLNMTYDILTGKNCTVISTREISGDADVCIDMEGVEKSGYNSTFENPAILVFKPWMLALHTGWHWNATMYIKFNDAMQQVATVEYRVLRTENYGGRLAYVVMENASNSLPQYNWVDAEKRVLLKTMGEGYEVVLTEGIPLQNE